MYTCILLHIKNSFEIKNLVLSENKKSIRYFHFLRPVLPNGFLSCGCFFGYMFFPSYLVSGSFKSKLIRKRVLRNHAGFLGYQFFVFLISIISDYIIWFSIFFSPSPFYFTGHDLADDHNSSFLSCFVMQFQYSILKSNEHSYSLSTVPKVAQTFFPPLNIFIISHSGTTFSLLVMITSEVETYFIIFSSSLEMVSQNSTKFLHVLS